MDILSYSLAKNYTDGIIKDKKFLPPVSASDNGKVLGVSDGDYALVNQQSYELPIAGASLGGVKNGGNVTVNADGTMTAPSGGGGEKKWKLFGTVTVDTSDGDVKTISWGDPNTGGTLISEGATEVFVRLSESVNRMLVKLNSWGGESNNGGADANTAYAKLIYDTGLNASQYMYRMQTLYIVMYKFGQTTPVILNGTGTDNSQSHRFDKISYVWIGLQPPATTFPHGMTAELFIR